MRRFGLKALTLILLGVFGSAFAAETLVLYAPERAVGALRPAEGAVVSGSVAAVDGNRFLLEDATAALWVNTVPEGYETVALQEGETLAVVGELNGEGEFDAFKLLRSDGTTTVIRPFFVSAPWEVRYASVRHGWPRDGP